MQKRILIIGAGFAGMWGAVHTMVWDRQVILQGTESKARKQWVNSVYIYPPNAERAEAFAAADPQRPQIFG